jgi:hypothetical protein
MPAARGPTISRFKVATTIYGNYYNAISSAGDILSQNWHPLSQDI